MMRILMILAVLIMVGCRTIPIDSAQPIIYPEELTKQDVKIAILNAVAPYSKEIELKPLEAMADSALQAYFGGFYQSVGVSQWYIEDVDHDSVITGFDNRQHYLRVKYIITDNEVIQQIDGSRNLKQTEDQIHKNVFVWMGRMESKIRRSMGQIAALRMQIIESQVKKVN